MVKVKEAYILGSVGLAFFKQEEKWFALDSRAPNAPRGCHSFDLNSALLSNSEVVHFQEEKELEEIQEALKKETERQEALTAALQFIDSSIKRKSTEKLIAEYLKELIEKPEIFEFLENRLWSVPMPSQFVPSIGVEIAEALGFTKLAQLYKKLAEDREAISIFDVCWNKVAVGTDILKSAEDIAKAAHLLADHGYTKQFVESIQQQDPNQWDRAAVDATLLLKKGKLLIDNGIFRELNEELRRTYNIILRSKEPLHLFKIGGAVLEDYEELEEALAFFSNLPGRKLLVHGGGRRASRMSRQLGIEPKLHEGRRITDEATLEVVVMVYAGLENKRLVSMLQAMGNNAIGLAGADGNVILAEKRPAAAIDYGYVGDVKTVNTRSLAALLEAGMTPVLCAITHDGKGQLLNTNADTIAAELAAALANQYQANLYYCFEKPGVMADVNDAGSVIQFLDPGLYAACREQGVIAEGMIPKLDNAFRALKAGAASVQVGDRKALALGTATQLVWTSEFPE